MFTKIKWAIIMLVTLVPVIAYAGLDFESVVKTNIDSPVIDQAADADENLVFLLTTKAVLFFSPETKTVVDRIPLKETYDKIGLMADDRLVLTNQKPSRVNIIRYSRIYDIDISHHYVRGPEKAKVTIVVFDDYECPYCARLDKFLDQIMTQFPKEVKCVIKHYPLSSHPFAYKGAMAALAAGQQNKFWEFHSRLLENHDKVDEKKILEIAGALKLDIEKFNKDRQSEASRRLIQKDVENGKKIGVSGTPSAFINGKRIRNQDLGMLPQLILQELEK